ncbi:MAG: response regulator [Candidatus Sulfotelmatobacter sp.]
MNSIVLVVDDEPGVADVAALVLEQQGYCALAAYSAAEAIKILGNTDVALILSDVHMPGVDGVELAIAARKECPRIKVLLMSGSETSETIKGRQDCQGCKGCPFQVMSKPFERRELLDRVEKLLN